MQKSAGKVLISIFWDQDCILLIDYLPKGQTINAEYYSSLMVQLKGILKEKRRAAGRSTRGSCSCTMARLTGHLQSRRKWPTWASNICSPALFSGSGPVGLPPILWPEKKLNGRHFSSDVAANSLDGQYSELFLCLVEVRTTD